MKITFKKQEFEIYKKMKVKELLKEEIQNNIYIVVGCKINNEYQNLEFELNQDCKVELLDTSTKEGMKIYRKSLLFVMGMAFEELYPEALITVNYQLYNSMFCEIDNMEVTKEIMQNVYNKMKEIIDENLPIQKRTMTRQKAEEFYKHTGTLKGKLQLDLKSNENIYMYFCKQYYNYFYDVLVTNTGSLKLFELVKYNDGFLIRYPSNKKPNELSKNLHTKKLEWSLEEYEDIHRILNVNTLYKLNKAVEDNKIKDIIMLDEALHEKKIAGIADDIARRNNVKMILIAGPSSSGKTTFAQRLGIQLRINGLKPVTISVDNYFVERKDTPKDKDGNYDFESLDAIDLELFNSHLTKLLNGEQVEIPEFDFHVGTKKYNGKKMVLKEDEILVIEGIHCLNDKLTSKISKEQKYKIYISALTVLNLDYYNRISSTDNRLIRRMVRDYQFRGYSAKHTLESWHRVNNGEEKNIFPFQETADVMFNTSLIYELGVLKNIAEPLLKDITNKDKEYAEAKRLVDMLKYFKPISPKLVPSNSLLKEFIGGGNFKY